MNKKVSLVGTSEIGMGCVSHQDQRSDNKPLSGNIATSCYIIIM
ncbi:hypothetical protein [Listeria phage vB_Lmo_2389_typeII]